MNVPAPRIEFVGRPVAETMLRKVAEGLRRGDVVPYLGPGVMDSSNTSAPMNPEDLAAFFGTKVTLPKRTRGNAWASAQHIEITRHRTTVTAMMADAFGAPIAPAQLQRYLATLRLPLIVDSWYDGAMRNSLAGHSNWGEIQGITRAGLSEDRWYRFYDCAGHEVVSSLARSWTTVLYKPHGSVVPAKNFLVSDADYVEVLTEIDIQTPIPGEVKARRTGRSFLFLGCRFNDQLLRIYARQVSKRSSDVHYAVVEPDTLSKNELRFLADQGLTPLAVPLARAVEILLAD
ncbi:MULTISPECIES: SIR2 family protein [unclassified Bradyrhizobium]|uniref:SIR2 family NAD-dependent protein deacylase n=1 Tax=unclassified Bradyrhizobium TaxID=2631580 RepID=UPI0020B37954|nr:MULTISPECIES: SIR2 family protein [unclassified Bradyrhizobium]MCP3380528.1 SIR2 family protein [Bradyrhizobium sp. CCGUVB4N]MCP3441397.1 SIR2 family protein [Bradyrhizobium sp. CCGUVB14]